MRGPDLLRRDASRLYGTEEVFVDGDDTPWSKALLTSAYASRGIKMRVSSGAGAEALMAGRRGLFDAVPRGALRRPGPGDRRPGRAERRHRRGVASPPRCPRGVRELMAENVMVMMRNLESCSGNDALMSESDMRRTSRTLPIVLAGSDFVFSGLRLHPALRQHVRAVQLQRRGHRRLPGDAAGLGRRRRPAHASTPRRWPPLAPRGRRGVPRPSTPTSGWPTSATSDVERAVDAAGSKDLATDTLAVLAAAQASAGAGLTVLDIVAALDDGRLRGRGRAGAGHGPGPGARRLAADRRPSTTRTCGSCRLVTDPNDYAGPGHRLRPSPPGRRRSTASARPRAVEDLRRSRRTQRRPAMAVLGPAQWGRDRGRWSSACRRRSAGRCGGPCRAAGHRRHRRAARRHRGGGLRRPRLVRFVDTVDLGRIGLAAARLAGSGIGIGLQAKGTALIHRRDLAPLANLELYSRRPVGDARAVPAARRQRRPPRQGRRPPTRPATPTPTRPSRPATTPP